MMVGIVDHAAAASQGLVRLLLLLLCCCLGGFKNEQQIFMHVLPYHCITQYTG